jgi:hypothetical protein
VGKNPKLESSHHISICLSLVSQQFFVPNEPWSKRMYTTLKSGTKTNQSQVEIEQSSLKASSNAEICQGHLHDRFCCDFLCDFLLWRIWTSKPATNVNKHTLSTFVINPLVQYLSKGESPRKKISRVNRHYSQESISVNKCESDDFSHSTFIFQFEGWLCLTLANPFELSVHV